MKGNPQSSLESLKLTTQEKKGDKKIKRLIMELETVNGSAVAETGKVDRTKVREGLWQFWAVVQNFLYAGVPYASQIILSRRRTSPARHVCPSPESATWRWSDYLYMVRFLAFKLDVYFKSFEIYPIFCGDVGKTPRWKNWPIW